MILSIEAQTHVGYDPKVYPSQELILDTGSKKAKCCTVLETSPKTTQGCTRKKVSNAIRTDDTWYPEYEDNHFPIAIEPYGAVTTLGKAFRQPKKTRQGFL